MQLIDGMQLAHEAILAGMPLDNSATLAGICLAERFSLDLAACIYPSSSLDIAAQAL